MTQMHCATVQRAEGRRVESDGGGEEEEGDGCMRAHSLSALLSLSSVERAIAGSVWR